MLKDKPWFKSLTVWGLILFGAGTAAEGAGALPPGTSDQAQSAVASLASALNEIGLLLAGLGMRRAVGGQ